MAAPAPSAIPIAPADAIAFVGLYRLAGNDGSLPGLDAIGASLGLPALATARTLAALAAHGLIKEDAAGGIRLGNGKPVLTLSEPCEKPEPPAARSADNVVTLPLPAGKPRSGAERTRRWRARKDGTQLQLPLFRTVTKGRARDAARDGVTAENVTRDAVRDGVTEGKRHTAPSPIKIREENQSTVTGGNVTRDVGERHTVTDRSYIYSSLLEEDSERKNIHTAAVTRDAGDRHTSPPSADAVIAHCLSRWPPRKGDNPRAKAKQALRRAWRPDDDPEAVVAAFERWRKTDYVLEHQGTQYIPQAATWLGQRRWEDYLPTRQEVQAAIRAPPVIDPAAAGDPRWGHLAERLTADIGPDAWAAWFGRIVPAGTDGGVLRVVAPTRFVRNWVDANYGDRLRAAARAVYGVERVLVDAATEFARGASARGPPNWTIVQHR